MRANPVAVRTGVIASILAVPVAALAMIVSPTVYALYSAVVWQVIFIVSMAVGLHRYFTHRSFQTHKAFGYLSAWMSNTVLLAPPVVWVEVHRLHHRHSETDKDPYKGYTPISYYFPNRQSMSRISIAMKKDKLMRLSFEYYWELFALGVLTLTAIGLALGMTVYESIFWMWLVPMGLCQLGLWALLAAGHSWGYENTPTPDHSKNSWIIAMFTGGEGFHNNHHVKPNSWNLSFKWWEFDVSAWLIALIKRPQSKEFRNE